MSDQRPSDTSPGTAERLEAEAVVHRAFAELTRIRLGEQPLSQVLAQVADLAQQALPHAREVSVTMLEEPVQGRPYRSSAATVAFTGDLAVALDERQYEDGFGPCLDAAVSGETIVVDTSDEPLYQGFAAQARRQGVTHSASVGLPIAQRTIGALNLYGKGTQFTAAELDVAHAFAGYAAVALANAAAYHDATALAQNLQVAMESRAVIEQAKGMVMAQHRCTADEAFDILRRASRESNTKLRTLCHTIVERGRQGA